MESKFAKGKISNILCFETNGKKRYGPSDLLENTSFFFSILFPIPNLLNLV